MLEITVLWRDPNMPDDIGSIVERCRERSKEMLKNDFRHYIKQSLGEYNPKETQDELNQVDIDMKISDTDWESLMYLYTKARSQIRQETNKICVLKALKDYANGILSGQYESDSKLDIDNFEHELDDYVLNNW